MITVLGAGGFIGRHLVAHFRAQGRRVAAVDRARLPEFMEGGEAGHVFYCIGLTADFRARPLETAEAHAGLLARVLQRGGFEVMGKAQIVLSTRLFILPRDPFCIF